MHRDRGRCVVPSCGHSAYVDVHHIDRETDGGGHDEDNLVVVCSAHHKAAHEGRIHIERRDGQVICTHADGTPYGQARAIDSAEIEVRAQALQTLVELGFRDRQVRRALGAVPTGTPIEPLLRAALIELRPPAAPAR